MLDGVAASQPGVELSQIRKAAALTTAELPRGWRASCVTRTLACAPHVRSVSCAQATTSATDVTTPPSAMRRCRLMTSH